MDVKGILSMLEKLQSRDITVHANRCVVVRNRNATCRNCAQACTSGAISLEGNELTVIAERCVGCGTCTTACPTGALEAHRPDDGELLKAALAVMSRCGGEVTFACDKALAQAPGGYDTARFVSLDCLGRVEESLLTVLIARGARGIHLVRGVCEGCERGAACATILSVLACERELMRVWECESKVEFEDSLPLCTVKTGRLAFDASRREFLTGVKDEARDAAFIMADEQLGMFGDGARDEDGGVQKMDDCGRLPQFLPGKRERLMVALGALGVPEDDLMDTRLMGHVIIDTDRCRSCGMCATFCPTGALEHIDADDGAFTLSFTPAHCVKCRCCVDVCPRHALSLSEEVFARDIVDGRAERYTMASKETPEGPHIIADTMRSLLGSDNIHER